MHKRQNGFTLIEIAIVLVIIGLLLGGVLKGQELITSARVRNLISNQDGIKAAYFGFLDRYRALPGDYNEANARANIPGCTAAACLGGNADGQISGADEPQILWEHLSKAGFITGSYTYPAAGAGASTTNTPSNPYGQLIQLIFNNVYREGGADTGSARHNLKTGPGVPSDLMAEVDRKVDDGLTNAGQLRHSTYSAGAAAGTFAECAGAGGVWLSATQFANCGAALLF